MLMLISWPRNITWLHLVIVHIWSRRITSDFYQHKQLNNYCYFLEFLTTKVFLSLYKFGSTHGCKDSQFGFVSLHYTLVGWVGACVAGDDWVLSLITLHQTITKFYIRLTRITHRCPWKCWYLSYLLCRCIDGLLWLYPLTNPSLFYYCYYCSCQNVLSCLCFYIFTTTLYT